MYTKYYFNAESKYYAFANCHIIYYSGSMGDS